MAAYITYKMIRLPRIRWLRHATWESRKMYIKFCYKNVEGKDRLEDLRTDGRILKLILHKQDERHGYDSPEPGQAMVWQAIEKLL
jgi:hypothetical protein